jgi:hypothetical protein
MCATNWFAVQSPWRFNHASVLLIVGTHIHNKLKPLRERKTQVTQKPEEINTDNPPARKQATQQNKQHQQINSKVYV